MQRRGEECFNRGIRKLLSILLLALVGLPLALPMYGAGESNVPMCCRRAGAHHCMAMMSAADGAGTRVRAPQMHCPFCPRVSAAAHAELARPAMVGMTFAMPASHPRGVAQVRSRWRVARERCRGKRGPPWSAFA